MKKVLIVLLAAGICRAIAGGAEVFKIEAVQINQPPQLDGKLDEPFWGKAAPLNAFFVYNGKGAVSKFTEARLACDSKYLYIGVQCQAPGLSFLQPKIERHDDWVSLDDSVEIFIVPGHSNNVGFHFQLSFANVKAEQKIVDTTRQRYWDCFWKSAAFRERDGWSAEMALPLYLFVPDGGVSQMRINIARNRRVPTVDAQHVVVGESMEASSSAPVRQGFFEPETFALIGGLQNLKVEYPLAATIADAQMRPSFDGEKPHYDFTATVQSHNAVTGLVRIAVSDSAGKELLAHTIALNGVGEKSWSAGIPDSFTGTSARVSVADAADGSLLDAKNVGASKSNIMAHYLDRNYYTSETSAWLYCSINPDQKLPAQTSLRVSAPDGKRRLGNATFSNNSCRVMIDLKEMPVGDNGLRLELCRPDGAAFLKEDISLVKRQPAPGREWKVDRVNRVVLNNDQPFFPFGFIFDGVKRDTDIPFKRIAEAGFNSFIQWSLDLPVEAAREYAEQARKHNLYYIEFPEGYCANETKLPSLNKYFDAATAAELQKELGACSLNNMKGQMIGHPKLTRLTAAQREDIFREFYQNNRERMLAAMKIVKDSPRLMGYYLMDEPVLDYYFNQSKIAHEYAGDIDKADGYRLKMTLYSSFIPAGQNYTDWVDILATDPYWIPGNWVDDRNTPDFVSKVTLQNDLRSRELQQVTMIVPMATYWSGTTKRLLTPQEQKCQTFLALIHGAAGIFYYSYATLVGDSLSAQAALDMGKILGRLAPIVVAPHVAHDIVYHSAALADRKETPAFSIVTINPANEHSFPDVQVCLKRNPAGGFVLLAANSKPYAVDVKFTLSGLHGNVGEIFDQANKIRAEAGGFSDSLEKHGVRAYTMALVDSGAPVAIHVFVTHLAGDVPPLEKGFQNCARTDRKNEFPNPSFEISNFPNRADYTLFGGGLNHANVLFGTNSVELVWPITNRPFTHLLTIYCSPQNKTRQAYTFSVHMKGASNGMSATLRIANTTEGVATKKVVITDKWQRYEMTGVLRAEETYPAFFPLAVDISGEGQGIKKVWVDGVQFEKGAAMTAYEE